MARPKRDGKRAIGIQGKKGFLYIVISNTMIKDGVRKREKKWLTTGLADTPENVRIAVERRKKILDRDPIIDGNILMAEYVDYVLRKKKREVSDTTYAAYFYRGRRIKDFFTETMLKDVNADMIERFLDELFYLHHVQPRTVKDIKVFLGYIMEQAVKDGIVSKNYVKEVTINKNLAARYAKEKNADDEFFTYEEAQTFLDKVKEHELYELFYLTLFFGLRREEILGLRWSAIDFQNKVMKINHTVTKGTMVNRANTTKTVSSAREYPLTDEQVEMFLRLMKKEASNRELCGNGYQNNEYVFKHIDGSLYYPDYPTKAFNKLIKRNPELPQGITFHGLRSSCVSILVHKGMDVKSIQKWVGHADIDTTLRIYAKVKDKEAKREISNTMNEIISLKNYK